MLGNQCFFYSKTRRFGSSQIYIITIIIAELFKLTGLLFFKWSNGKWLYFCKMILHIASSTFCNTFKVKCPVNGVKIEFSFIQNT